jgi:hypothetical protein
MNPSHSQFACLTRTPRSDDQPIAHHIESDSKENSEAAK